MAVRHTPTLRHKSWAPLKLWVAKKRHAHTPTCCLCLALGFSLCLLLVRFLQRRRMRRLQRDLQGSPRINVLIDTQPMLLQVYQVHA
jgi:hypothetical protein